MDITGWTMAAPSASSIDGPEVRRAVAALFSPDEHYELRGLPSGRSRCVAGYDTAGIIAAARLFADDRGTYYTLNPVDPALGDRGARVADVVRRRHFLVDVDPVKADPDGSATQVEKDHAKWLGDQILATLNTMGWPFPIVIDSGNGAHLAYRVDLPNDDETRKLFGRALKALALAHDTEHAKVDTKVHNASRIAKLPGTWARKGPDTADRPHRLCKLVAAPSEAQVVPLEKLVELAGAEPERGAARPSVNGEHGTSYALAALHGETAKVIAAGPGSRNSQLFESALKLAGYVQSGELTRSLVEYSLTNAGRLVGLDDAEIARALSNGLDAGSSTPKHTPSKNGAKYVGSERCEGSETASGRVGAWGTPRVRPEVDAVPFPLDALPAGLAELCNLAAATVQCPVDYFGAAAVALAGAAVGMSVNLAVKPTYVETPALYLGIVGPPGSKKSPAFRLLARPFYKIDAELRDSYIAEMKEYRQAKDDGRDAPVQRQLTLDDTTREAVAQVHAENPRGLALLKDELTSWVASLDAYRGGKGDDKQFWLKVNSGMLVKVNRKTARDAPPILVPHPCVTILGGITPDNLVSIRPDRDDGWIDRLLFSYPEPTPLGRWTEDDVPAEHLDDWDVVVRCLWSRPMVRESDGRDRPYLIRMDRPAKALWREWVDAHRAETTTDDFPAALRGPWSKLEGYAARLVLILARLHQAYDPERREATPLDADATDVWKARKLADYFKAHFRRARARLVRSGELPDDAWAILRWCRSSGRASFSERDARLNFRGRFGADPLALAEAVETLVRRDCIRPLPSKPKGTGRPPSPAYEVNPRWLGTAEPDDDDDPDTN
jgi:hypothetical protein